MSARPLPRLALRALADPALGLVANSRGTVVHVADISGGLTRTGRLPRGRAPLCGQRALAWRSTDDPTGRPLCARCAAHVQRRVPDALTLVSNDVTADEIAATLRGATDLNTVDSVVWLLAHGRSALLFERVLSTNGRYQERLGDVLSNTRIRLRRQQPSRRTSRRAS